MKKPEAPRRTEASPRPLADLRLFFCFVLLVLFALFAGPLFLVMPADPALQSWQEPLRNSAISLALFAGAQLLHGLLAYRLSARRKGQRPVPRVLLDLFRVVLLALATLISLSLFLRQDLSGLLTGSGLVLAVLGFAIRNVVADTFSGIALGIEAPFRIGDWVRIEHLAQGRVQEIGWRTTRLVTRDSTYVILPNSQISRQRITNFSAPRKEYRDHAELLLPLSLPVAEAVTLIRQALEGTESIAEGRPPEVQIVEYGLEGILYRVKYWVPQHDRDALCRTEVFSRMDAALRAHDVMLTSPVAAPTATPTKPRARSGGTRSANSPGARMDPAPI